MRIKGKFLEPENGVFVVDYGQKGLIFDKKNSKALKLNKDGLAIIKKFAKGLSLKQILKDKSRTFEEKVILFVERLKRKNLLKVKKNKKVWIYKIIKNKTKPFLNRVMIEITNSCNLHCQHCYVQIRNFKNQMIVFSDFEKIISEMEEIGIWQLDLTGGEATLHPDFEKIVEKLKNSFIFVTLFTNLAYKNKKKLKKIIELKPKLVVTSIDGSCPKIHDSFRGEKGAWKNTVNNIKYLKNKGLLVRVNVIISDNNYRDLPKIIDLLENGLRVDYVLGDVFCFPGCANLKIPNKIIIESIYKYRKKIYLKRANQKENKKRIIPPCGVSYNFVFINSKGEISLCPTLTKEEKPDFCAGNIHQNKSIKKIWEESEVFEKYRFMQCKKIKNCKCVNYCKGGCRSRAFFEQGNVFEIDPINCGVAKKIYEKNKNQTYSF